MVSDIFYVNNILNDIKYIYNRQLDIYNILAYKEFINNKDSSFNKLINKYIKLNEESNILINKLINKKYINIVNKILFKEINNSKGNELYIYIRIYKKIESLYNSNAYSSKLTISLDIITTFGIYDLIMNTLKFYEEYIEKSNNKKYLIKEKYIKVFTNPIIEDNMLYNKFNITKDIISSVEYVSNILNVPLNIFDTYRKDAYIPSINDKLSIKSIEEDDNIEMSVSSLKAMLITLDNETLTKLKSKTDTYVSNIIDEVLNTNKVYLRVK